MSSKFVVVDTETTGLTAQDRVVQLAYYVYVDGQITIKKNFYFMADVMDAGAEAVHGLTLEKLKVLSNGLRFKDVAEEVAEDFSDAVFVAHNADFDYRFISNEFRQAGVAMPQMPRYCVMKVLTPVIKLAGYKFPKLSEAVSYFNVPEKAIQILLNKFFGVTGEDVYSAHDARYDITCVACIIHQAKLEESIALLS